MSRERVVIFALGVYFVLALFYRATGPPTQYDICDYTPNSFVPVAVLTHGSFDLRPFEKEVGPYLIARNDRQLSFYPIGAGVSALPFYVPFYLLTRDTTTDRRTAQYLGQSAATFFCAASASLLFVLLLEQIGLRWSLFLTAVYGLGTCVFSILNKALWQHGPAVFWLTLVLFALLRIRGQHSNRWAALAGFSAGMAVLCRPTNVFFLMFGLLWIVFELKSWKPVLTFCLGGFPAALSGLAYNSYYWGDPLSTGGYGTTNEILAPNLARLAGLLISPGRGLLVFLPFTLLLPVALYYGFQRRTEEGSGSRLLGAMFLATGATIIAISAWSKWFGGVDYGPRILSDFTPFLVWMLFPLIKYSSGRMWKSALIVSGVLAIGIHSIGVVAHGRPDYWEGTFMPQPGADEAPLWSIKDSPPLFYLERIMRSKFPPDTSVGTRSVPAQPIPSHFECQGRMKLAAPGPEQMKTNASVTFEVEVTNLSNTTWPASQVLGQPGRVYASYRWYDEGGGNAIIVEGWRSPLPKDLLTNQSANCSIIVTAPQCPGRYVLRLTLVAEGVQWCDTADGTVLDLPTVVVFGQ